MGDEAKTGAGGKNIDATGGLIRLLTRIACHFYLIYEEYASFVNYLNFN